MKYPARFRVMMMLAIAVATAPAYATESKPAEKGAVEKPATEKSDAKEAAPTAPEAKNDGTKAKSEPQIRGIELGKFSVRTHRAVPTQMNRVSFTLYATVPAEQVKQFQQLLEHRENKVHEQVIVA